MVKSPFDMQYVQSKKQILTRSNRILRFVKIGTVTVAVFIGSPLTRISFANPCVPFTKGDWHSLFAGLTEDTKQTSKWDRLNLLVQKSKASCQKELKKPELSSCLSNLEMFVANQAMTRQPGHSMQFRTSDKDYLATVPTEMIALPDELKDGLPKDWKESVCKLPGWTCLEFVSKSLPNPPRLSYHRLLITVRSPIFDRWMLFTMPSNGLGGTEERLIDFMAIEKQIQNDDGTFTKLEKPKIHFVEYYRDSKGKNPVYRKNIASCYKCHPSGMKDIVPAYGSTDLEGIELAKKLNSEMKAYGKLDWSKLTIDPDAYGPPMRSTVSCTSCHNGNFRGVLNAAHLGQRSRHQIYFKLGQDLTMPPGLKKKEENSAFFKAMEQSWTLNDQQRNKLYRDPFLTTASGLIGLELGSDAGPPAVSNAKVLKFLLKEKKISKVEYQEATKTLKRLELESKETYVKMKTEYEDRLKTWLKGDRPECEVLFKK